MKNFMMSGSGRMRNRSWFMRMLMGIGALATTYIIMPRARKMVDTAVRRGMAEADVLVKKGKETADRMMAQNLMASEKKSLEEGDMGPVAFEYYEDSLQAHEEIEDLKLKISRLEAELEELRGKIQ
jgi:hypothetical protein